MIVIYKTTNEESQYYANSTVVITYLRKIN